MYWCSEKKVIPIQFLTYQPITHYVDDSYFLDI